MARMGEAEVPKRTGKLPEFDKLWDYAHPDISEQRFRELLPRALDSLDLSYLAQLLTQIARAEGLQRKFEDAHKTLDRVDKALPKTDGRTLIRYLLERGRVYSLTWRSSRRRTFTRWMLLTWWRLSNRRRTSWSGI